jgi:hypothetical protein
LRRADECTLTGDQPIAAFTLVRAADRPRRLSSKFNKIGLPMSLEDSQYLERRAEEAIRLAQQARHPAAVRAHYSMASNYLSRLYPADNDSPQPPNRLSRVSAA